jgi:hypothetical protein
MQAVVLLLLIYFFNPAMLYQLGKARSRASRKMQEEKNQARNCLSSVMPSDFKSVILLLV